jgi:bacterioferritin-associated ferredoxin
MGGIAGVSEKHVKEAVKKRLNAIGAYHHWPVQMGMGNPCLDCHGCLNGLYFAIETKRPGGQPTLRQRITAQQIRNAGGLTFVIDTVEKARALFDDRFPLDGPTTGPL